MNDVEHIAGLAADMLVLRRRAINGAKDSIDERAGMFVALVGDVIETVSRTNDDSARAAGTYLLRFINELHPHGGPEFKRLLTVLPEARSAACQ